MPLLAVAATLVTLALAVSDAWPALRGPAPYPPEWQWPRRSTAVGPLGPALAAGLAVLGLIAISSLAKARRLAVPAAIALGFAFQLAILGLEPEGPMPAVMSQTVYRTATSYLTVAASEQARDPLGFLRRHHELLPELRKTGKHASTHPPGPVLFFRGVIAACERSPALTRAVLLSGGFEESNPRRPRPQHPAPVRAAALLGGLLIAFAGAATAWPIERLARAAGSDPPSAARVAALWAVVPAAALMTPMLDQALCLPVAGAAACLATAAARPGPAARRWAAAAGVLGGLAVHLSYGAPVFLALGGLAALAPTLTSREAARRALALALIAAAVAAALWCLPAALGHHPLASLRTALAIHRDEYTQPRRYPLWLAFNLVDLAMFLGVPVAVAWVLRIARSARRFPRGPVDRLRLATAAGLAALVLSGVTRGEVGRLWLPLMPLLLVAALARPGGPGRGESLVYGAALAALTITMALYWQVP